MVNPSAQMYYRFTVKGHLDPLWSTWFDGLSITNLAHGEAVLVGPVVDQAALYSVLMKMRDLGLVLLAVDHVPAGSAPEQCTNGDNK